MPLTAFRATLGFFSDPAVTGLDWTTASLLIADHGVTGPSKILREGCLWDEGWGLLHAATLNNHENHKKRVRAFERAVG